MTPVITISNQKGGVAKTTTADAIAEGLRARGLRVLAVDADSQGSLGMLQERYAVPGSTTTAGFMKGAPLLCDAAGQCTLPGDNDLVNVDSCLDVEGSELDGACLARAIDRAVAEHGFDAVVVDTAPGINFANICAIAAATHLIVPTTADVLGIEAVRQEANVLEEVFESVPGRLADDPAILITQYRTIAKISRSLADQIQRDFPQCGFKVFNRRIPVNVAIQEAQIGRRSIFEQGILRGAPFEYDLVVKLVMEWCGIEGKGAVNG